MRRAGYVAAAILALLGSVGRADEIELPPLKSPGARVTLAIPREGLPGRFAVLPLKRFNGAMIEQQSAVGATVPLWHHSVVDQGTTYTYYMVGRNPMVKLTNPATVATTLPVGVFPIRLSFLAADNSVEAVFDPSAPDATCSPAGTATGLALASPVFQPITATLGSTTISAPSLDDLFQRANFWRFTQPSGLNPGYHTTVKATLRVEFGIPVLGGIVETAPCGQVALIDYAAWDSFVQNSIFPALFAHHLGNPGMLPVFLLYNVAFYNGDVSDCCILGYHGSFYNPNFGNAFQTYVTAEFDTSQAFGSTIDGVPTIADVTTLGHEVAEWMDDPAGNNPTPPWGGTGQVTTGCQSNLEVADPLTGSVTTVPMPNGYTYHIQDLAFAAWFYGIKPSPGVNGWYSLLDTFTAPAASCTSGTGGGDTDWKPRGR